MSNVDSQESFKNIVVQVIGEISNKAAAHRKFVQTFVLAEQPKGYFVLNDIFRYILEDEEEEMEDGEVPGEEGTYTLEQTPLILYHVRSSRARFLSGVHFSTQEAVMLG